ncbi:hypothetical protein [Streptomyces sp. NPDC096132]
MRPVSRLGSVVLRELGLCRDPEHEVGVNEVAEALPAWVQQARVGLDDAG